MIGGYQIIDLRGIDLEVSESASDISNARVLNQLLDLRGFIDKSYDFSKPLETQLKPVLLRFRDKKNGEKIEGVTYGELSLVGNYYTFKITGRISGQYTLEINVEFKEITNDYGNKVWVIKTATIQLIDASNVLEGDIAIDGDLSVSGGINGVQNPSVKPIYCHPLTFSKYNEVRATAMIFDNDPTPYNYTRLQALADAIYSEVGNVSINIGGAIYMDSEFAVCQYLGKGTGETPYELVAMKTDGTAKVVRGATVSACFDDADMSDAVNKIN